MEMSIPYLEIMIFNFLTKDLITFDLFYDDTSLDSPTNVNFTAFYICFYCDGSPETVPARASYPAVSRGSFWPADSPRN